ncbi:TRAP transporter small permease [Corynebacterium guangdongense]|uniref:TRAP-type C4-dicarboxylate transport system permease small subunit n=1 Tax=Corynebacterium guangdongense TaxID=1783348 RepID=A0ABU1ZXB7_9CORY|nr:TRAP transporter small permease [Corynebacterium guangdongense]MDR7329574.1 TRAP-type C4-dicarboxylate transport system permease small subunit [Corynebacterium guangdongense]WJZ18139.1 Sialic acid TRAP transporter permease protein SiaT [Corynebacterium guangdongense]
MSTLRTTLNTVLAVVSVTLFALLVATVSWQVFSRQVIHEPSTWSEELAKILFVWLSFLGSAFLFGERGHIAVDFLARQLSPMGQRVAQIFVQLMILVFALMGLVWGGVLAAQIAWNQNLTALPFTIGWVYTVIPLAGAFIAVFAVLDIIGVATGRTEPYPEIEDAEGTVTDLPSGEGVAEAHAAAHAVTGHGAVPVSQQDPERPADPSGPGASEKKEDDR